jgi:drug/metabolite transporter (DMT)-like permease
MPRDFLKLHFIIILWGFTAVLGHLIDLPAVELVAWRTAIAAAALALVVRHRSVPWRDAMVFAVTGTLIGIHWMLFFLSVKVANVSICMVGMATISLWTSLLEPVMVRGRKLRGVDLLFGAIVIAAVYVIFRSELEYSTGFLIAIASAIAATIFSIINGTFANRFDHHTIALYEMVGACLVSVLCLPLSDRLVGAVDVDEFHLDDLAYLLVLALVCTVYSFSQYVELLNRLSVFTVNFANNLEPVYGILLGAIILKDFEYLGGGFYAGAAIILAAVIAYPLLNRHLRRRREKKLG